MIELISPTASDRLRQAERRIGWASLDLEEMASAGLVDELDWCERMFSRILSDLNIAWEALRDASKDLDGGCVAKRMADDRRTDALLHFFWHARNVDVHQVIERRIRSSTFLIRVIDHDKASIVVAGATTDKERNDRLFTAAMGVSSYQEAVELFFRSGEPTWEQIEATGIRVLKTSATLTLLPFRYQHRGKIFDVGCPNTHLGMSCPNVADRASQLAIEYYTKRLSELQHFERRG